MCVENLIPIERNLINSVELTTILVSIIFLFYGTVNLKILIPFLVYKQRALQQTENTSPWKPQLCLIPQESHTPPQSHTPLTPTPSPSPPPPSLGECLRREISLLLLFLL
jgi:hypothetical protein